MKAQPFGRRALHLTQPQRKLRRYLGRLAPGQAGIILARQHHVDIDHALARQPQQKAQTVPAQPKRLARATATAKERVAVTIRRFRRLPLLVSEAAKLQRIAPSA